MATMMNKPEATPKPHRPRPQAEKSAETRERTIRAAIVCLHRSGYAATTLDKVARQARVSRGAMSHQFPTKIDLMVAVVEAVYENDAKAYALARKGGDPATSFRRMPEVAWQQISQASGIAVIEIMLASRSDRKLMTRLRDIQTLIDRRAHSDTTALMESAGMSARHERPAIHRLMVAAMRGLAIEALFMGRDVDTAASFEALLDARGYLYNHFRSTDD